MARCPPRKGSHVQDFNLLMATVVLLSKKGWGPPASSSWQQSCIAFEEAAHAPLAKQSQQQPFLPNIHAGPHDYQKMLKAKACFGKANIAEGCFVRVVNHICLKTYGQTQPFCGETSLDLLEILGHSWGISLQSRSRTWGWSSKGS